MSNFVLFVCFFGRMGGGGGGGGGLFFSSTLGPRDFFSSVAGCFGIGRRPQLRSEESAANLLARAS